MEFILNNTTIFWIVIGVLFLIIEGVTMGLTTLWFAAGAFLAVICSLAGAGFSIQFAVFLVSSVVFLAGTRKIFVQKLGTGSVKTNIDALIGERTLLLSDIKAYGSGSLKLNGKEWTAVTEDRKTEIKAGTEVEVIAIEGVKAVVRPLQ